MDVRTSGLLDRSLPLLLPVAWGVLYWPTFAGLLERWLKWDEAVAHGLPVTLIFLYFLFRRSNELVSGQPGRGERWLALVGVVTLSVFWATVEAIHIDILAQLVLLPVLVLGYAVLYGFSAVRRLAKLWPFFLFAVPVWDYLNGPLLYLSSEVVGALVRFVGMPAVIQGNSIFIPQGHILIADGCSGLRYLIIALALGYLVALLNRYSFTKLAISLAVAGLLGLVTNWARIFILILVGYQTEMQSSLMSDHEYFGWALFALICFPALYWAPVIRDKTATQEEPGPGRPGWSVWGLLTVALAVGPAVTIATGDLEPPESIEPQLSGMGLSVGGDSMPLRVSAPPAVTSESIRLGDPPVYARLDQYIRTGREQKLVPYIKRLYNSDVWLLKAHSTERVGHTPVSRQVFRQKVGNRMVVQLQWFNTGGYRSASIYAAKLWQIPAVLRGRNRFTITTLQAQCAELPCEAQWEQLQALAQSLMADDRSK